MTDMIFEVSVRSYSFEGGQTKDSQRIFGKDSALRFALEIGACTNVLEVDVMDALTGEIILTVEDQEVTWMAD